MQLPITLTDALGTWLGIDAGAGLQIQSLALKVHCEPPEYVSAVTIQRSGILAPLSPFYESSHSFGNSAGYLATFSEATQPLPPMLAPGSEVATVSVAVSDLAQANTAILVAFDVNATILANQGGSLYEAATATALSLTNGSITISKGSGKPVVTIKAVKAKATIKGKRGKIRLSRSGATAGPLAVQLSITGSAKNGRDYRKINRVVTIPRGARSVDIDIIPINLKKGTKGGNVIISVASSQKYAVMPPGSATVVITK